MKPLCVCEICNCGRHRCTPQLTALYPKSSQAYVVSEYTEKYPGYMNCQPPKRFKPKQEGMSNREPIEDTTTMRSDFIPYEVSPRPGRQRAEYQPKPGVIDLDTTYKQEFGLYELKPVLPQRPRERIQLANGKLDTVPTYKEDFQEWQISKRELPKPKVPYNPPVEKFGNATTFQDDFAPCGLVPRKNFKPLNVAKVPDVPFDGVTSNQLHYIPHPVDAHCVKAPHEYKPSDQPFQDLTTHRQDFQGLPGQMPKSYKPEHIAMSCDAPFPSSTEFRDCFQSWAASPIRQQKTSEYRIPTVEMDMNTTSGTTFIKHHIQPFIATKPLARPARSSVPFQGNTTTKEDFKAWKAQRQEMIRKPPEIHRSSGKMEDMSTSKAHYIQHQLQPTISCKPLTAPLQSEVPFDEETMYSTQFTPKKINACPARSESFPGYVFEKVDERGHRFFHKLSPEEEMSAGCELQTPNAVAIIS